MAILTGLSSLLGGLSNTTGSRTGTSAGTTTGTNTGSSTPVFSALQGQVQGAAGNALMNEATNGINITPAETAGTGQINQTYKGIGDRLQESLSQRGFGNSGASGTAALQTELGRAGAVGGLQSNLQSYALSQQQAALQAASGFGFAAPGQTTSGTTSGSTTGTYTNPGSVAAGALSGGLTAASQGQNTLMQLMGSPSFQTSAGG